MNKYNPSKLEKHWYAYWEKQNFFSPDQTDNQESFTIIIPPPNITGSLHIGHALVNGLQDILIRWQRMKGKKTLWLPGTDHASIATQLVVEKNLKARGITKESLGRAGFEAEVWRWKESCGSQITDQLKQLGASLDWSRERFTLDPMLSDAVLHCFKLWYDKGWIYRGEYLVNWCPKDQTALSDLEVEHIEVEGQLSYIRYPILGESTFIEIATTRPETMLGDTAVCVHPKDPRYTQFIGKTAVVPLVNREVKIIADERCKPEFGTGAVKITPAHDPLDFQIGKDHQLKFINIFTKDAKINAIHPELQGLDRQAARIEVSKQLKELGLLVKVVPHVHQVGHSQRQKTPIEPRLSTQWFCKMQPMAEAVLKQLDQNNIRLFPDFHNKVLRQWLENIQDWCISRQLWWGHRIPAFYCQDCEAIMVDKTKPKACTQCGSTHLEQDQDVLDTWFSSGLFPFSTMGWPKNTADLKHFYPNSVLVTGYDILFFWVARMLMMGLELTQKLPFPAVFMHGLVRDNQGEKMSKTKGNVINPLVIIEEYGADALRFTLCSMAIMSRDLKLDSRNIVHSRNFINKLWNAVQFFKFHQAKINSSTPPVNLQPDTPELKNLGLFDAWILKQLNEAIKKTEKALTDYRFFAAAKDLENFVWHQLCDWYIELCKPMLIGQLGIQAQQTSLQTLNTVLSHTLRLLHPIIPFVTEELWHQLGFKDIIIQPFPQPSSSWQSLKSTTAEKLIHLSLTIRNLRGENQLPPNKPIDLNIHTADTQLQHSLQAYQPVFQSIVKLNNLTFSETPPPANASDACKDWEIALFWEQESADQAELLRLQKTKSKLLEKQQQLKTKLGKKEFISKAPAAIIQKNQNELAEIEQQLAAIQKKLKG